MTRKPRSSETEEERQKRLDETARKRGEDYFCGRRRRRQDDQAQHQGPRPLIDQAGEARNSLGLMPVQRLKARLNAAGSEKPSR